MQITMEQLKSGSYDYLPYQEMPGIDAKKTYELSKVIDFMLSDEQSNKVQTRDGQSSALPTRNFAITINKEDKLNVSIYPKTIILMETLTNVMK